MDTLEQLSIQSLPVSPLHGSLWDLLIIQDLTGSSGVTGGGAECPPETSDREISGDLPGKKGKGVKIEKKRRKIVKGKMEIELLTFQNH